MTRDAEVMVALFVTPLRVRFFKQPRVTHSLSVSVLLRKLLGVKLSQPGDWGSTSSESPQKCIILYGEI